MNQLLKLRIFLPAELPLGRVKRLLKSNSMTAIANINFGWRRETSV